MLHVNVAWLLSAFLGAVASPPKADNLLLVSIDTARADRFGAYGYAAPTTPVFDALAVRGAFFERAYTHVPETLPAHCSLMTGLLPPSHGVRSNRGHRLGSEATTLAEILAAEDFATAAFVAAVPLARQFGLDQGFALYDDDVASHRDEPLPPTDPHSAERPAAEVAQRALSWLRARASGERWFLFVHFYDPHLPYDAGSEEATRFGGSYEAEIARADVALGHLLEGVAAVGGNTLVVVTADHGEGLGDHSEPTHNRFLYNSTLQIPLALELSGWQGPGKIGTPVGLVDLFPTALELLSLEPPPGLAGSSLVPLLNGRRLRRAPVIYSETLAHAAGPAGQVVRSLVVGNHKLIRTERQILERAQRQEELYALMEDPGELSDSSSTETEIRERLSGILDRLLAQLEMEQPLAAELELDDTTRAQLEALGYL